MVVVLNSAFFKRASWLDKRLSVLMLYKIDKLAISLQDQKMPVLAFVLPACAYFIQIN